VIGIRRKHSHFVPSSAVVQFLAHWMKSWLIAWAIMLPIVVLAAPFIRSASLALTRDKEEAQAAKTGKAQQTFGIKDR
jgi:hypothetical protein